MPQPLSLRQLVNEIDGHPEGWCCYVSRSTGEIVTIPNSDNAFLDSDDEEWAEDAERVSSGDFIAMPGHREIDEYRIMERFCDKLQDVDKSARLTRAIAGKGAFRRFKDEIHRLGVRDEWFRFKAQAIGSLVRQLLDDNKIPFVDDLAPAG